MGFISNEEIADALDGLETVGGSSDRLVIKLAMERLRGGVAPDVDGWIKWGGGEYPPVRVGTPIYVRHRDTEEHPCTVGGAYASDWTHTDEPGDIIAYRIVK